MCWTPEKKAYATRLEAFDALHKQKKRNRKYNLEPYYCTCGWWHLRSVYSRRRVPYRRPKYPVWKGYK